MLVSSILTSNLSTCYVIHGMLRRFLLGFAVTSLATFASGFSALSQRLHLMKSEIEGDLEEFAKLQNVVSSYLDANDSSKAIPL